MICVKHKSPWNSTHMADVIIPSVMVKSNNIYKLPRPEGAQVSHYFHYQYYIQSMTFLKIPTLDLNMPKSIPPNRIFFLWIIHFHVHFSLYGLETKETEGMAQCSLQILVDFIWMLLGFSKRHGLQSGTPCEQSNGAY